MHRLDRRLQPAEDFSTHPANFARRQPPSSEPRMCSRPICRSATTTHSWSCSRITEHDVDPYLRTEGSKGLREIVSTRSSNAQPTQPQQQRAALLDSVSSNNGQPTQPQPKAAWAHTTVDAAARRIEAREHEANLHDVLAAQVPHRLLELVDVGHHLRRALPRVICGGRRSEDRERCERETARERRGGRDLWGDRRGDLRRDHECGEWLHGRQLRRRRR